MTQRYRIEELFTGGWELIDSTAQNLTKEECDQKIQQYLNQGVNPNYLRAVLDA
jgi:hypothetical protein